MRSTSVLTKKPTRSSSALSVRPAIGLPIGMSVPAPSRVSSAASAACSTMNRLAWPVARERQQTAVQLGADVQRHAVAAIARDRRSRPVARQFDLIGKILERCWSRTPAGAQSRCPDRSSLPSTWCCHSV